MIFKDILNKKVSEIGPMFNKLFELAIKNQVHPGDLLLINENGFYNKEFHTWESVPETFLPYSIGIGAEGLSEIDQYMFIDIYRNHYICDYTFNEYLELIRYDPTKIDFIDKCVSEEKFTIHLEMLIYLKIWESDAFLKRFYQLARLINNEEYDWHFNIAEGNRALNATGTRQKIIGKTMLVFQKYLPDLAEIFRISYQTQVRNSIAHSKYSFMSRNIHLNNYIREDKYSTLHALKFDEWIDIFHNTMILYNEYIRIFETVNQHYVCLAHANNNLIEIKINVIEPVKAKLYKQMMYRPEWNDFVVKFAE